MDIACDDRNHCKQVLGFFVLRHGEFKSPQFTIVSNYTQNGCVLVSPIDANDLGVRLALFHQDIIRGLRFIGFTSKRNQKLEYYFTGVIPFGRILLIPVEGHDRIESQQPDYPYEDYVTVFEEADACLRYSQKAEDALEFLFETLDADNNGFLSASEMSVFKEFLGLQHGVSEDEWSDALFGWQDGDLDYTLTEMSFSFFKAFIVRFCQRQFSFSESWTQHQEKPYPMTNRARRIKNLERIFECFGFNKNLVPGISRYSIRIYTERNSMSKFTVIPRQKVTTERVIKSITKALGKKMSCRHGLTVYRLQCPDWLSLLVKNHNVEPKEVVIESCIITRTRGVPKFETSVSWRKIVPGDSEMVMIFPPQRKYGFGHIEFHCATAPVQNLLWAISTCTTLASSVVN